MRMTRRRMGIRHIEAFRAVSVTGSMTEAARRIHTSQPQISRLISQLEAITGFALFSRSGSRIMPTAEGARFFKEVEQAFAGLSALEAAAARIRSFSASRLTVAAMPRLAGGLLARAVARFKTDYPDVVVSIHSGDAASVHSWISSGQCDLGLAMLYGDSPGVRLKSVSTVNCVAIMPKGHPLAALPQIEALHFQGERFISPPTGSPLRRRVDAIFATSGVQPNVTAEASLGASICALVSAGVGVALINPFAAAEEQLVGDLDVRPFSPRIPVDIVLMYPEHQGESRLVEAFADRAIEMIVAEVRAKASPGNSRHVLSE